MRARLHAWMWRTNLTYLRLVNNLSFENGSTPLHVVRVGRDDIGWRIRTNVSVRRRTKSDDPVRTGNVTRNPWKYYREFRESCGQSERGVSNQRCQHYEGGSAKVDVVLCNASSRKFRVHEGKIRVGARNIVFTAEWNDDTWIQLIFILDEDGWLRPMNLSFRCCNWWNCNALMTVFSFLFGTLHEDILQGKVNGIIVTGKFKLENTWWNFLAWKIELAMEFLQGCQGYDVFYEWRFFFFFETLHGNIPQEVNNCTRKLKLKKI